MIGLLQRVTEAHVSVGGTTVGAIGPGLLVLVGVQAGDTAAQGERLLERLVTYRVFADEAGRMNRSLVDTGGGLLLVPQFTLAADTHKGTRPGFSTAAAPALGQERFLALVALAEARLPGRVATGVFGADMQVALVNDGPVTFWLEIKPPDSPAPARIPPQA
jgi:D-tyrosyl-tRNA(Tyr) deacylase